MFLFLMSYFGYVIKIRLFSSTFQRFNFEKNISIACHCLILTFDVIVILATHSLNILWWMNVFEFALIIFAPIFLERRLERILRESVVTILDQIILSVQAGIPLRGSVKSIIDREVGWRRIELSNAYAAFVLSTENSALRSAVLRKLFDELRAIDQSRSKILEQLRGLRWQYAIFENFRRKSGQVSQQTRIQSAVMSLLYVALLVFCAFEFDLSRHFFLVSVSISLFISGLILVFLVGRRVRWKI